MIMDTLLNNYTHNESNKNKLGCYSVQLEFCLAGAGVGLAFFFFQKLFIYVMLRLCAEFQCSTMPGTGQKVCGGGVVVWWWCGF